MAHKSEVQGRKPRIQCVVGLLVEGSEIYVNRYDGIFIGYHARYTAVLKSSIDCELHNGMDECTGRDGQPFLAEKNQYYCLSMESLSPY